jgi:BirA family transcriptional regulator, biotin operon repressor / biotin---[acetyl-CoA-carboxylase] ligase
LEFQAEPIAGLTGWRHHHIAQTGSTNSDALAAAKAGDPGHVWFTSDAQISGRGRLGRAWVSEPGNLYASVLLLDPAPVAKLGTLPFVAALALYATLSELSGMKHEVLKLKWPNDLLVNGAKISGILLENAVLPNNTLAVVCGFGVNVVHHPDTTLYPATDLQSLGIKTTAAQLHIALANNFASLLHVWNSGQNFAAIRTEWLSHAANLGKEITVNLPTERLTGKFIDMDSSGCLILGLADGTEKRISAGDVFFSAKQE